MREEHIIQLLENNPVAKLSTSEVEMIKAHTTTCESCQRAYAAACISQALLADHAAEIVPPPPFFQTRVLAQWRERQEQSQAWSFARMWRTAGALVSSMAATVALLAFLTVASPDRGVVSDNTVSTNVYSAEEVILNQGESSEAQTTDAQVFRTLYGLEEDRVK